MRVCEKVRERERIKVVIECEREQIKVVCA